MNKSVLLLSIDTVSQAATYEDLDAQSQALFLEKQVLRMAEDPAQRAALLYEQRGALHPEFARILVIGLGFMRIRGGEVTAIDYNVLQQEDEKALLEAFLDALPTHQGTLSALKYSLCAHNGLAHGFLFLYRRLLVHGLPLPLPLQIQGLKPWQLEHLEDTLALWRVGGIGAQPPTSLVLLAKTLGLQVPDILFDISTRNLHDLYHSQTTDKNTQIQIKTYAQAQLYLTAAIYARIKALAWDAEKHAMPNLTHNQEEEQ